MNFKELGINEETLKSINFEKPTQIQEKSIPLILEGKDVIAQSETGSGKTFAFGVGVVQKAERGKGIQGLIVTPTRELAEQVTNEMAKFSRHKQLRTVAVYGGVSINPQITNLMKAEIVVGTPGRLLDHLERGTINLNHVKILVLDEADRMLDMGFIKDVKNILKACPPTRQTLLFSATMDKEIIELASRNMNNPYKVSAGTKVNPKLLKQVFYDVSDSHKLSLLVHMLKNEKAGLIMVFCNTQRNTEFVAKNLRKQGIRAEAIHGGLSQAKRTQTISDFQNKGAGILVCTDVAARGLHINDVSHVYNYDMPMHSKEYTHRIGRTARAGGAGIAINLISKKDHENFSSVLRHTTYDIERQEAPQFEKIAVVTPSRDRDFDRSRGGFGDRGPRRGGFGERNTRGGFGEKRSFGERREGGGFGARRDGERGEGRSFGDRKPSGGFGQRRSFGDRQDGERRDTRSFGRRDDQRSDSDQRPRREGGFQKRRFNQR